MSKVAGLSNQNKLSKNALVNRPQQLKTGKTMSNGHLLEQKKVNEYDDSPPRSLKSK